MSPKRAVRLTLPALFLLLVGLGCSLSDIPLPFWPFQPVVRIINHPEPNLAAEIKPFLDAGCTQDKGSSYVTCPVKTAPFSSFGCTSIRSTTRLGALKPDVPIMMCTISSFDRSPPQPNVYDAGCLVRQYVRYIVFQDGKFRLLSTLEEFRAFYAPVESPDEALSYALAVTGLSARFNQKLENYRYKVTEIEDTFVIQSGDSYTVNLFSDHLCGCGPHASRSVVVAVSRAGEVVKVSPVPLYEDPKLDGLCVD